MIRRVTRRQFMKTIAALSGGLSFPSLRAREASSDPTPDAHSQAGVRSRDAIPLDTASEDLAHLDPISVEVGRSAITLRSGPANEMIDCRSLLYWRPPGGAVWTCARAEELGNRTGSQERGSFTARLDGVQADIVVTRFMGERVWRLSGTLTNERREPIELARFHYLDGTVSRGLRFLELVGSRNQPRLRSGRATVTPRVDAEDFWRSARASWPEMTEPVHDQAGWFVSTDIGAIVEDWNRPGWGFGFVGPGEAFGEIGYRGLADGAQVFVGVLMDGVRLDPGETRPLESAILWCGDWQAGLNVWARACAAERRAPAPVSPWAGYCSWHQKQTRITPRDIEAATREFAVWPAPPGGRTIQIDDGFQIQPGNWDPNDRFRPVWPGLARRIAATGSLPGLWLSPTAVHETHPIVHEHPDWLQRLPSGDPAIWLDNWGRTFFLEPDHPEVRAWIRALLRRFRDEGWRYFKLDFTYVITSARRAHDSKKSRFQTLRDLYALIREAAGPEVRINACIGTPSRYALGYADTARLGADMTQEFGAVKSLVQQLLTRTSTHGVWWQGDPDCFAMFSNRLSEEERRVLTGTIGLYGGLFLTADLPSQWTADEAAFVRRFWSSRGPRTPRSHYVVWNPEGEVTAYRVSHGDTRSPTHGIALYNWSDSKRDTRVRLPDAHLDPSGLRLAPESLAGGATMSDGVIRIPGQPAHSLRIVGLTTTG